jgi:CspA family cold shock protein
MPIGTVKFFNRNKGYGFITPAEGGNDVFVHISAVERAGMKSLKGGQFVGFDLTKDAKGRSLADKIELGRTQGNVKFFNPKTGFGFITPADGGNDAFVHISAVERAGMESLNESRFVNFDLTKDVDGRSSGDQIELGGTHGTGDGPRG